MKMKRFLCALLCLSLIGCMLLLTACPNGEPPVVDPGNGGEGGNPPVTPPESGNVVFGEGVAIDGAGDSLTPLSPVFTAATYDAGAAQGVPAGNFMRVAAAGFAAGKVFAATGANVSRVSGQPDGKTYDGKGTVLIVENGLEFTDNTNMTLKNLVIVGDVTVKNTDGFLLERVEIVGTLKIESTAKNVAVTSCRLTGDVAVENAGTEVTVLSSYIGFTANGVKDSGAGLTVQNCRLEGTGTAVTTSGADVAVKYNTFALTEKDTGISVASGAINTIAAMNLIRGAQASVSIDGARNAVVVRNTLISVKASANRNLYICDNQMGGRVEASRNNYFLADGNTYAEDNKSHTAVLADNDNTNGDTLTNVEARLEVGADEDLLPHVDKDQFVGMARKTVVKDVATETNPDVHSYIVERVKRGDGYVFVAPGAYVAGSSLSLTSAENATIYAYGVYAEETKGNGSFNQANQITLTTTKNITIKGLTVGYADQSSGQVHILEKMTNNRLRVIASPGMVNEFSGTSETYFPKSEGMYWHRLSQGQDYVYCDVGYTSISKESKTGTMIMTVDEDLFDLVQPGDVFTCRTGGGQSAVSTNQTTGTVFKDMVVYGTSGGLCFVENNNRGSVTYYRVADTSRAGEIITPTIYNKYLGLEQQYEGVSFYMSQDEWGNYHGTPAYISSIDATHVNKCAGGSQIISCLFENMCDDGTNQKSTHARLAGIRIEGDEAIITFKGNLSQVKVDRKEELKASGFCAPFEKGDHVYIYTTEGQLICDSEARDAQTWIGKKKSTFNEYDIDYYEVRVKAEDVLNLDVVDTYDLTLDQPTISGKILVDNRTRASNGFFIDNTMIKNTRSRGLLLKSSFGTVKNCTFRNNAKCGIAVIHEVYWGESSVSESVVIERNLFDNTSYSTAKQVRYRHAPLIVAGLSSGTVAEDCLLYKNIDILNNKFVNRNLHVNAYAVYLQGVRDVNIIGNDFGTAANEDYNYFAEAVCFNGAKNIKIEGNTYSPFASLDMVFSGDHYVDVYGGDVEGLLSDRP